MGEVGSHPSEEEEHHHLQEEVEGPCPREVVEDPHLQEEEEELQTHLLVDKERRPRYQTPTSK